jgi:predicted CoA-binding protein
MLSLPQQIEMFFSSPAFAVVGASTLREKFGNKVLRCYLQHHKKVYPVNPREKIIEAIPCIKDVASLPDEVKSISIITPPKITEQIVDQAIQKGIQHIWMQPGAESDVAIEKCKAHGINVIAGGPCILVQLGFKDI